MCVKHAVKKAYYKLSLPYHPQIAGKTFRAARKFQALGKIYDILSDVNKRRVYNGEGCYCNSQLIPVHQFYVIDAFRLAIIYQVFLVIIIMHLLHTNRAPQYLVECVLSIAQSSSRPGLSCLHQAEHKN